MNFFASLWDHLWQSTLFAMLIWCLVPLFRDNGARVRYGLWFAASLKFLVPFSLFTALGRMAFVQTVQPQSMAVLARMRPVAMPFSAAAPVVHIFPWMDLFLAVWLAGITVIAAVWAVCWYRVSTVVRTAQPLVYDLPIPVRSAEQLQEPGLVGIWDPVILLPKGILDRLSRTEIDAVLHHELCHWRRRDNLLSALHMLVACTFWFHPLVWFLGARLVEERERACDEEVLAAGGSALEYAKTILKVCELYLRSPLPCAAGVSGADLDRRITAIMARTEVLEMDLGRKSLLMVLALVTVLAPFITGALKPAPIADVARSLVRVLVPVVPAITAPSPRATNPSSPAHRESSHHPHATVPHGAVEVHQATLVAPPIDAQASMIIVPTPRLETEEALAAEPESKVCRPPQQLTNSRLMGPEVCLSQQAWNRIRERGLFLMPDGRTLAATSANQAPPRCSYAGGSSASSPGNWPVACY
jgi:beta-lactamase regulating signal transducer with metallopeptidase domain